MTPTDNDGKKADTEAAAAAARGEKLFSAFDYAIKVVKVAVAVLGVMLIVIALSGVDMASLDGHEIFRYRMYAAPALVVGYLLIDWLLARRRATRAVEAAARDEAANVRSGFALSVDPDADRHAAEAAANDAKQVRPKRGYLVELMALTFVAAGGAAFWHDQINHEIPNAKAVPATFVSARCVDRSSSRIGGSVAPHMLIGYEFVSLSTSVRDSGMKCFVDNCEQDKTPRQYMDIEHKKVFYASLSACQAELPAVLAARAPTMVWTGDKDPNAAIRARFTPERDKPPYFLLWFPSVVSAVILLISGFARRRSAT